MKEKKARHYLIRTKIIVILLAFAIMLVFPVVNPGLQSYATCSAGIMNNGLGGINIDINAYPYSGPWKNGDPYGQGGCTWFVGSRVMELTGKGGWYTQVGETWFNSYGPSLGFSTGQEIREGAILCWSGHVAFVERIEGSTVYYSEGGSTWYSDAAHGYGLIRAVDINSVKGLNSGFIGCVYTGASFNSFTSEIEVIRGVSDGIYLKGWTFNKNNVTKTTQIHVYLDGMVGSGAQSWAVLADKSRTDVDNAYHVGEFHGFETTITGISAGNHTVYLYANDQYRNESAYIGAYNVTVGGSGGSSYSDFHVGELREGAFTVMAKVTAPGGVSKVEYAIWTEKDGQDDIVWHPGYCTDNNDVYWARVNFSDHKGEKGKYIIHMYITDNAGNQESVGLEYVFKSTGPEISNIQVSDIGADGYTVSCKVTDTLGVLRVQFPSWTINNGQDDIASDWNTNTTVKGTKNGDVYTFRVKTSDHNGETGLYRTHIYAYDILGNATSESVPDVNVHKHNLVRTPAVAATETSEGNTEYWTCSACGKYFSDAGGKTEIAKNSWVIKPIGHNYGSWEKFDAENHRRVCANDASHVEYEAHIWDGGEVTTAATEDAEGVMTYTCTVCGETREESIAKLEPSVSVGMNVTYNRSTYKIASTDAKTVSLVKARNIKNFNLPETIDVNGETYKVVAINAKALTGANIRKVTISKNVKKLAKNAFRSSMATTIVVKSKLLTKARVKGSLTGSKVKTVQVKVGSSAQNKKYVKTYKKIFTKTNAGRKVTVR